MVSKKHADATMWAGGIGWPATLPCGGPIEASKMTASTMSCLSKASMLVLDAMSQYLRPGCGTSCQTLLPRMSRMAGALNNVSHIACTPYIAFSLVDAMPVGLEADLFLESVIVLGFELSSFAASLTLIWTPP